ncbi:MAG: hypothetical protein HY231_16925 [Acidobacteria bacterium]|nr:hypothetical protein [Acidobacteriota bacterium]
MQKIFLAMKNRGGNKLRRSGLVWLLTLFLSVIQTPIIFAHGGEDHGDQKPIAAPVGQMNVRLAKTDAYEVLVKYPNPKPAEETVFRIFLTDLKTNAPVEGLHIAMTWQPANTLDAARTFELGTVHADTNALEAIAQATDTPGIYQAPVVLPEAGQFNIAFQLSGKSVAQAVTVTGIVVSPMAIANGSGGFLAGIPWLLLALIALPLLAALAYFLFLRPRIAPVTETEPAPTYAGESEHNA